MLYFSTCIRDFKINMSGDKTMIEKKILLQAQQGDEIAIEIVMKQYQGAVYKNSQSFFLKGGDHNDLIQEGYIGLMKAIKGFDEKKEACFATFANLCIKRQIISTVKKYNIEKYKILNDAIQQENYSDQQEKVHYNSPSMNFHTPEEILLGKELLVFLEKYLKENLSPLEKKVFHLLAKQYTYIEIAEMLNDSPKRIDNTIQRIRKKILIYLESYR